MAEQTLQEELQAIAGSVARETGFAVVAISVFRDSDELEILAVAGDEQSRADLMGDTAPIPVMMEMLRRSEDWGALRFLRHGLALDLHEDIWVGEVSTLDHPDAWQPYDVLNAPVIGADGSLRGLVGLDRPLDGLRPGPERRGQVEEHAARAAEAVLAALEHDGLVEQLRLTEATRRVIRATSARLDLADTFAAAESALLDVFRVDGAHVRTLDMIAPLSHLPGDGVPGDTGPVSLLGRDLARRCWSAQRVAIVAERRLAPGLLQHDEHRLLLDYMGGRGLASLVLVPLGVGDECLGALILHRSDPRRTWTDEEAEAALDIGHDLGRATLNARSFSREQDLIGELQRLGTHRAELIQTVAHELKNPLASILGHLELVEGSALGPQAQVAMSAIQRSADRLHGLVSDLLVLSEVEEGAVVRPGESVDLHVLVRDAIEDTAVLARRKLLTVELRAPDGPVPARGDERELSQVVVNLIGNAVKYTPEGRRVEVVLETLADEVLLTCADEGIGLSERDRERVFEQFFRSTNPEALAIPGTGLGLAIVHRIVSRHRGRIEVDSKLGVGTTFRVALPLA